MRSSGRVQSHGPCSFPRCSLPAMPAERKFLEYLAAILDRAGLEAILVGNAAAQMHGAPVMTEDIDLLVRDTPLNRTKLARVAEIIGAGAALRPLGDVT